MRKVLKRTKTFHPGNVLLSIRPQFANPIISGEKTVELRRRFSDRVRPNCEVWIYSTSPVQSVVAKTTISQIKKLPISVLWRRYRKAACVEKCEFDDYFDGLDYGYAIIFGHVKRLSRAVKAAELQKAFGFVAPQSYRYIPTEYHALLRHE